MNSLTSLGRRIVAAAFSADFNPRPNDVVLSICRDSPLGSANDSYNAVTLLHLLELLQNVDGSPHVAANGANLVYTWKVIGWYPRARWLARSADNFAWRIAVSDGTGPAFRHARRHWSIRYDYSPDLQLDEGDFVVPYGVSPQLIHTGRWQQKDSLRAVPRDIRLLFAGSCHASYYDKQEIITARFGKMTRHAVIGALRAGGGWFEVSGPSDLGRIHGSERPILIDSARA